MKLASVKPHELAVIKNGEMVLVGNRLAKEGLLPSEASMIDIIANYDSLKGSLSKASEEGPFVSFNPQQLKAPVAAPSKIWVPGMGLCADSLAMG